MRFNRWALQAATVQSGDPAHVHTRGDEHTPSLDAIRAALHAAALVLHASSRLGSSSCGMESVRTEATT